MGWFDEQIRQRKQNDDEIFAESFINVAGAVAGSKASAALHDERRITKNAFDEIMKFYHVKSVEIPEYITDQNEQLEYLMRPHGIMRRKVKLDEHWYHDAIGAMLATRKDDGSIVALIPRALYGYRFFDKETGSWQKVNRTNENLFEVDAICFYKSLPLKKIGITELGKYIGQTFAVSDFVLFAVAIFVVTLLAMFVPKINSIIFSDIVDSGNMRLWFAMLIFWISVSLSTLLFGSIQNLLMARIKTKMDVSVQAAVMMRILSLPADFFKNYSSGDLSMRTQYMAMLCEMITSSLMTTGLTSIFSLVYITQIFLYAPALVIPSLVMILATLAVTLLTAHVQMQITQKRLNLAAKTNGLSYALISGIQKIKLAGAEKRAFARWANEYAEESELEFNPPIFIKINTVITTAINLVGVIVMYYLAVKNHVTVGDYYAFQSAYGLVDGAFITLSGVAMTIAQIKPIISMVEPILKTVPENSEGKQVIAGVKGGIELSHITFQYQEHMPKVIDDLSLSIRPGQYVAIVGATGCGKSTLVRLMLGFETPQRGTVFFDGKDLSTIDLKSLRRKIGVVMQDGKLLSGDIFSNIIISAPQLTVDDAWKAAEIAGVADDIRSMPMGMHTMVSEGSGGISGGQKQRLMIARAIAPKPKILIFDEATSALDNLTQKQVSEALDQLKCTRIVVAHRLSTIRQCDRIIFLNDGKIAEDGTYEELIQKQGLFAELVERQRLD